MRRRAAGWEWWRVSRIHHGERGRPTTCTGEIYSYRSRYYAPSDSSYERCIGIYWCSICRECSANMVFVARDEQLPDPLADLPTPERERLARSELKLLDYLDRLVRRGTWPDHQP
ncbi:hypothetical protein [Paractinoplanes durhamensis]|uniref:Uncharacterized protein n=1 Tax=Paractinoplanes durhamensis TaxID=113563 RepID=A0ABQ3Z1Q5_9ACTN|nr:hypothetical protein [Actinoplanes durhamensis]GIE03729.1 hypothetical protein Adu01nite_50790 [Actinoplanes durhamensis]